MNTKTHAACIFVLTASVFLCSCNYFWPGRSVYTETLPPKVVQTTSGYYTQVVQKGTVVKSRLLSGKFAYAKSATFTADKIDPPERYSQAITITQQPDVFVKLGDHVKKGQKIAQAYTNVDTYITQAQEQLKHYSDDAYAKEMLNSLLKFKATLTFVAPFDGVIVNEPLNTTGTVSGVYPTVVELADPSQFYFTSTVTSDQYGLFRSGEKGKIVIDTSSPDDPNHGKDIEYDGQVINSPVQTASSERVVHQFAGSPNYIMQIVGNYDKSIVKDGTAAAFKIISQTKSNVITVPNSAIRTFGFHTIVSIMKNGCRVDQEVTTGLVGDDMSEVVSGLSVGDVVVFN